ncbi:hypothetical protein ACSNOK_33635, partial [Streptomyces sp. URMC 126]|uniref:hypothetical protein n=1 Tax=Streptomyces sp. URMC 126 TaxID=3423401 RepID=UPI003F1BD1CA
DLGRGRIPNIPAEMGIRSAWKYDRQGLLARTAVAIGVSALAWALLRSRTGSRRRNESRS